VSRVLPPIRRSERVRVRGFTLTELLAVLAMIGVIVVAGSPTFVNLLRDRRVNRAAMQITDYMRTARTMAIGRGQPMLVAWTAAGNLPKAYPGGTGYIQLDEPVVTNAAATQIVSSFDIQNGKYAYTAVTFYDDAGTTPGFSEICFAPSGRMYLRNGAAGAPGGAFHPVVGVPTFAVFNTNTNVGQNIATARWVFVPPSGAARMQL
jgi:prepilin-type N-terminal cleavage/methylation domain-containing protein